jgi:hypothetical protein
MSCRGFAKISIHLRFGKFMAPCVGPCIRKAIQKFLALDGSSSLVLRQARATMVIMMSESIVDRYLKSATTNMMKNNDTEIRRLCRRCKLGKVFDSFSDKVQQHLLMRGFIDGYTQALTPSQAIVATTLLLDLGVQFLRRPFLRASPTMVVTRHTIKCVLGAGF